MRKSKFKINQKTKYMFHCYHDTDIKMTGDFLTETIQARKKMTQFLSSIERKYYQPRFCN